MIIKIYHKNIQASFRYLNGVQNRSKPYCVMLPVKLLLIVVVYTATPVSGAAIIQETEVSENVTETELDVKHEMMSQSGGDIVGYEINHPKSKVWTGGDVPYVIHSSLSSYKKKLIKAFNEFHSKTCIKFRPKNDSDKAYIQLKDAKGCNSYVGRTGMAPQNVNLNIRGCLYHSTIVHELGHAIGLYHTHQRSDRDKFIKVNYDNIMKEYRNQFDKEKSKNSVNYDTKSVMHYDSYAASKNGQPTMTTKNGKMIKDPPHLSSTDIEAIKLMYNCK